MKMNLYKTIQNVNKDFNVTTTILLWDFELIWTYVEFYEYLVIVAVSSSHYEALFTAFIKETKKLAEKHYTSLIKVVDLELCSDNFLE